MTLQNQIRKWLTYALAVVPIWLLDAFILPRLPVFGVSPMLLPACVAAVAVREGCTCGTAFGMGVGLFWELAYPGGFGIMVFAMALAGFLAGKAAQLVLSRSFLGYLFCSAVILAVVDLARVGRGMLTRSAEFTVLLQVAVPEYLLSLLWTPVIYAVFWMVYQRVGGERLR